MNQDWRSPAFREEIRNKIANAMQGLGDPPQTHPPVHMEEQMFNRSNSAEEYRNFVDKLLKLLHQKRMGIQVGNQGENSLILLGNSHLLVSGFRLFLCFAIGHST